MSLLLLFRPRSEAAVEESSSKGFYLAWDSVREWERAKPKPKKKLVVKPRIVKAAEVTQKRSEALDKLAKAAEIQKRISRANAENVELLASLMSRLAEIGAKAEREALEKQKRRLDQYAAAIKADYLNWLAEMDEIDTAIFMILASED